MEEFCREKSVTDYYVLCCKLKHVIRKGWVDWNVSIERRESVAEHIFSTQMLALAMWSQFKYDLDIMKIGFMLSVHEMEEAYIGDLTAWDITPIEKKKKGEESVKEALKDLFKGDFIESTIREFDRRETKEARFAYHCDKLDCDLQVKIYDEEERIDIEHQVNNPSFMDPNVQFLLKEKGTCSGMWLQYGRDKYGYDDNFRSVSIYAETHRITGNKSE